MYCPECGEQLQVISGSCPMCGVEFNAAQPVVGQQTIMQPSVNQPQPVGQPTAQQPASQPSWNQQTHGSSFTTAQHPMSQQPSAPQPFYQQSMPAPQPLNNAYPPQQTPATPISPPPPPIRKNYAMLWVSISAAVIVAVVVILVIALAGNTPIPENEVNGDSNGGSVVQSTVSPVITPPENTSITTTTEDPIHVVNESWAVYWYLCGSDLESNWSFASEDLEEMLRVQLPENVTVVIETGGARRWERDDIDSDGNYRFVYDVDGFRLVEKIPVANMGSSRTLENFLQFCNDNYPADRKAVIFWNHGGGSVVGLMYDELFGDILSLDDMRRALEAVSPGAKENPPYELIGFDACFMATIDVVESLNGYARWMVASQEWEPGIGWDYEGLFQALADDIDIDGYELGKAICDSYYAHCIDFSVASEITLSVVDMGVADRLLAAYYDVGAESLFYAAEDITFFGEFGRAARSAVSYGGNTFWDGFTNMVDLGDLVRFSYNLLPVYGSALLDALDEAVVYMVNGPYRDRASGLSSYYSFNGDYEDFRGFASLNDDSPYRWFYEFKITGHLSDAGVRYVQDLLQQYSAPHEVKARSIPTPIDLEDHPVILRADGYAELDLGTEVASQLTGVYCYIAYYDLDYEIIIMLGRTDDLNADWDNGVFTDNFFGYWGSIDGHYVYMELVDGTDDYRLYTVPVLLNGEEFSLSVSYRYSTDKYEILGARRGIDDQGIPDRDLRLIKPGDVIEPLYYMLFDMDDYDEEFTVMPLDSSFVVSESTRFEEIHLGDGVFILIYEMVDIQNNSYLSEAVAFLVEDGDVYLLEL